MDGQHTVTLRAAPLRTCYPSFGFASPPPFRGLLWKWRHGSKHWRPARLRRYAPDGARYWCLLLPMLATDGAASCQRLTSRPSSEARGEREARLIKAGRAWAVPHLE